MADVLLDPVELTDAELDQVTGGILNAGLVNADVILKDISVLNNNHVNLAVGVLSGILQKA